MAQLFSTGQHHEATELLVEHIVAGSPGAESDKMLIGRKFDDTGRLVGWNMCSCKISALPQSFSALACSGSLLLNNNLLKSLPSSFGQLKVGGSLYLSYNQLESLPASFGQLKVGGDLGLGHNHLKSLPTSFSQLKVGGNLNLSHNRLESLLSSFYQITVYGNLILNGNQLGYLPVKKKFGSRVGGDLVLKGR